MGSMIVTNLNQVMASIDRFVQHDVEKKTFEAFQYLGESFIRAARTNRQFKDDTGALQSSIGYIIAKDGQILQEAIKGIEDGKSNQEGKTAGLRLATAVLKDNMQGWVLIGVAGMDYGIYVEARGIDVISGSIPETQELMKEIIEAFKGENRN